MFKDQNVQKEIVQKEVETFEAIKEIFQIASNNPKSTLNNTETGYSSPEGNFQVVHIPSTGYFNINQKPEDTELNKPTIFSLGIYNNLITLIVHPKHLEKYQEQLKNTSSPPIPYDTDHIHKRMVFSDKKYQDLGPTLQKFIDVKVEEFQKAFKE